MHRPAQPETPNTLWCTTTTLLECDFGKAPQLARMQPFSSLRFELFECAQADLQVLADPLPIELASHAGELDLSVQRPVRNAEQRAVGYTEAETVGGDGRRFHVERNGA